MVIPEAKLVGSAGRAMPCVGLGTALHYTKPDLEGTYAAVLRAVELGYRHFDTATLYGNEHSIGNAIAEALRQGLIQSRDELFITSKLWCSDAHPDRVIPALRKSLKNLQLDYLDLYLIHWPVSMKPGELKLPWDKDDFVPMNFKSVWEGMEDCQNQGLAKAIGVSNFSCEKLDTLISTAKIIPAVVQVEMNPMWQQKKLMEYCKKKGIHICAYSPLGASGNPWGTHEVMDSQVLKDIADSRRRSVAQICLRWLHEQGVTPVVKSFNEERMKANLEIFDWALTEDDLRRIDQLPQRRVNNGVKFISSIGPYKTVEEFWDGDI